MYSYLQVLQKKISNQGNLVTGRTSPRENMLFCRTVSSWLNHAAEKKTVKLTAGQPAYYVISQNIRLENLASLVSPTCLRCSEHLLWMRCWTQCPQLATHSAAVTFFSCWFLRPIRSGELSPVGRPCVRGQATFPLFSSKPRPRLPNMVGCLWQITCPLRVFLDLSSSSLSPSFHQFTLDTVDEKTTAADGSHQLPSYVTEQPGEGQRVSCIVPWNGEFSGM